MYFWGIRYLGLPIAYMLPFQPLVWMNPLFRDGDDEE